MNTRELLDTALEAARTATEVHRRHLGRVRVEDWSEKGIADFVTHVDREAEERIVDRIRARFPDHAFLAEEGTGAVAGPVGADAGTGAGAGRGSAPDQPNSAAGSDADWLWIIDPLDGTTNFLHAYPMYAVSIAVLHRGEPVAGVVISGATGEEWSAVRAGGAYRNGERIQVSKTERLEHALIGTGFPFRSPELLPRYLRQLDAVVRRAAGVRRAGSAALDLCHVATGYLDGFWELLLSPWDIAAGMLIIREAGGVATTNDRSTDVLSGGPVLAGNPWIYEALRELLPAQD